MTARGLRAVLVHGSLTERVRSEWRDRYDVLALADFPDVDAFIDGIGRDVEVIVSDGSAIPHAVLTRLPRLRLVACFSTGHAGIDTRVLKERGISLTTAAGINAHDVADHALALILGGWSRLVDADRAVREGRWRDALGPRRSLRGRAAGIVGFGRIGSAIAARLVPHEVTIAWYGPHAKPEVPFPRCDDVRHLAARSDILVVASRAAAENRHQIGEAELAALGPEGLLVNVSRGLLVDEEALRRCLRDGRLGAAALDVFEDEPVSTAQWRGVPNLLMTPHVAGYTREAGPAMMGLLAENVRRHFAGEPLATPAW